MFSAILPYLLFFNIINTHLYPIQKHEIISNYVTNCDSIPQLNKLIVAYAESKIGKKVDRGECWDLAAEALKSVNAKWDGAYVFGRLVNQKKECIFPGDVIQFEGVKTKYKKDNMVYTGQMLHHTAIIYQVISDGNYKIAEQNTGGSKGKKVSIGDFDTKTVTKGKYMIYRPTL